MWLPTEGKIYQDNYTGRKFSIIETPETAGKPLFIANNLNVLYEEDGVVETAPVVWWRKRKHSMELIE